MKETAKSRFSDRVENYVKYRPSYPKEIISFLVDKIGLNANNVVADIGSGTGLSSQLFISLGCTVFGVEPNKEMRDASSIIFKSDKRFIAIDGSAEHSGLEDDEIDLVIAGQAFHWFDEHNAKKEFNRILKKGGAILLMWNSRDNEDAFQIEYEALLKQEISNYKEVLHRNISDRLIADFLSPLKLVKKQFVNKQHFNFEQLKGRLLSSSYCPQEGAEIISLFKKLEYLYEKYSTNDQIEFKYKTQLYLGIEA